VCRERGCLYLVIKSISLVKKFSIHAADANLKRVRENGSKSTLPNATSLRENLGFLSNGGLSTNSNIVQANRSAGRIEVVRVPRCEAVAVRYIWGLSIGFDGLRMVRK